MNTNRWIWNNSNIHNNTSAGTVLHTIKGERTAGLLSNNLSRFADVRWPPTTPGLVFSLQNQFNRRHNASSDCCRSGLHLKKVSSPQSDHFTNVVVQLLRCRLSRPPRVSTDVTQRRRDDNLQDIWRASPRVLCSKLHYLRLCRPKITSI